MSLKSICGIDALRQQVDAQRDEVDVAGALAVAEEAALDAVGAGHVAELGRRDRRAAVVVGVQREDDVLAVREVAAHPLDRVGVDVRRRHLDRRRQVDDHLAVGCRLEDLDHLVADVDGELELGARVALGRVLVVDLGLGDALLELAAQARAFEGDVDDALLVGAEDDVALQHARRVVQVHDRLLGAGDRLVRALDEVLARLRQHLDRDVVGDDVLFDEVADEVEVRLARRREARPRSPCSPCSTSRSNMMRLRSGLIGSMSAWLPSRRSTAHQRGALVMRASGHVRSGRCTAICS